MNVHRKGHIFEWNTLMAMALVMFYAWFHQGHVAAPEKDSGQDDSREIPWKEKCVLCLHLQAWK